MISCWKISKYNALNADLLAVLLYFFLSKKSYNYGQPWISLIFKTNADYSSHVTRQPRQEEIVGRCTSYGACPSIWHLTELMITWDVCGTGLRARSKWVCISCFAIWVCRLNGLSWLLTTAGSDTAISAAPAKCTRFRHFCGLPHPSLSLFSPH